MTQLSILELITARNDNGLTDIFKKIKIFL